MFTLVSLSTADYRRLLASRVNILVCTDSIRSAHNNLVAYSRGGLCVVANLCGLFDSVQHLDKPTEGSSSSLYALLWALNQASFFSHSHCCIQKLSFQSVAMFKKTPQSSAKKPGTAQKQRSLLNFFTKTVTSSPVRGGAADVFSSDPVSPSQNEVTPLADKSKKSNASRKFEPPSSPIAGPRTSKANYAESSDDEDFQLRAPKRRRRRAISEEDENFADVGFDAIAVEESEDDFVVPDDDDEEEVGNKRKRKIALQKTPNKSSRPAATPSSTSRFAYSAPSANTTPSAPRTSQLVSRTPRPTPKPNGKGGKHAERHQWLVDVRDADKNKPDHPDYDPRTIYIPPSAWNAFTPFEKQYWEIKSKLYNTIVFFKKGKFYELYEDDATIGHQEFDLKVTDRVNMRMVGVPEYSVEGWVTQFIAKGYRVARVEQCETALGKEMREVNDAKVTKEVIGRELSCILTAGTLVDELMLQDDMSRYCVAIKEDTSYELPVFGISFVDTATGSFSLTEFEDDVDLSKFETFVAQIRPQELILEKGCISNRAVRILKNNTSLTTIWNKLKPGSEFWDDTMTIREIDAQEYFKDGDGDWPEELKSVKSKDLVMSAFGALLCYLQSLKIDRELVTMKNFRIYDPIKKATSLILDGKTLVNLEIFTNTYDGSAAGTLFAMLSRCITPFGKRMFKQWVCHPLADAEKINQRLDAVDAINSNHAFRDAFTTHLSKLPDLERLISRVHSGNCRAIDFLRVLEGFERIQTAVEEIKLYGPQEGLIGQLISKIPDLETLLKPWRSAFDREKVKKDLVLIPQRGVEEDLDGVQDEIEEINTALNALLKKYSADLRCKDLKYVNSGNQIYLVEVPIKFVKYVPQGWDKSRSTTKVHRYTPPEVLRYIRPLQEARETYNQLVKQVSGRLYKRFDKHYSEWLLTVQIIANLDCLVGLAQASESLGDVSCRPTFLDQERTTLNFEELRHPCMSSNLDNFIPNDICLGGELPKITLLTGANAAGKSTILRMTCIGVIMAQIGCYVPCKSAALTPVDRIMSRLGANDNIFAAQSTFFVELSETKKILADATPRSLVILDELGRGTSSYDGVAVAQSVLHHIATHVGCIGYFATHYHSLVAEFSNHLEVFPRRMQIHVDEENRNITFLYKLEQGVAEGSFGMHCAAMCGVNQKIIDRAEEAAKLFEHTSRLKDSLEAAREGTYVPLGLQSDIAFLLDENDAKDNVSADAMKAIIRSVEAL